VRFLLLGMNEHVEWPVLSEHGKHALQMALALGELGPVAVLSAPIWPVSGPKS